MNPGLLLASAVWLLFQAAPPTLPTLTGPLRNTFVTGAETVIDNASTVDIKAADVPFEAQMKQLRASKDTLSIMANDDREKDIVSSANNIVFLISACHIQAKSGAATSQCESQFSGARNRMMESINKHKSGGAWVDGPPA